MTSTTTTTTTLRTQFSQVPDQNGHIFREVFRRLGKFCAFFDEVFGWKRSMGEKGEGNTWFWGLGGGWSLNVAKFSTDVIRCHKTTKKLVVYFKEMLCSTGKSRVVKILILIYPDKSNLLFDVWKGAKELGKYLLIYHQILQKIVEAQWQLFKKEESTQEWHHSWESKGNPWEPPKATPKKCGPTKA